MRCLLHFTFLLGLAYTTENNVETTSSCSCTPSKIMLDIVVTVDTSTKMTERGLTQVLADISTVFGETTIAQGEGHHSRLALVTYASQANVKYDLNYFKSTEQMLDEIWNIESGEGSPNLESAITTSIEVLKNGHGGGIRKDVKSVIVMYASDLRASDVIKIERLAKEVQRSGTHIIVVAFKEGGKLKAIEPLEKVASPRFFFKSTMSKLGENILSALCKSQC